MITVNCTAADLLLSLVLKNTLTLHFLGYFEWVIAYAMCGPKRNFNQIGNFLWKSYW
jgi:hypothetical protein